MHTSGHFIGAVHVLALGGFLFVALKALLNVSILRWPEHIFSDPWATSTFVDWLAGLPLILTHIWSSQSSSVAAFLWTICVLVFGNAATMFYGIYRVWSTETLKDAFVPATTTTTVGERTSVSSASRVLQGVSGIAFLLYAAFGLRALIVEDWHVGFAYLTHNYWPFTQFVNTLLGHLFAAIYIGVREGSADDGNLGITIGWIIMLALFGNLTTCIYLLLALGTAHTISEAVLGRHPVSRRAGYIAIS